VRALNIWGSTLQNEVKFSGSAMEYCGSFLNCVGRS